MKFKLLLLFSLMLTIIFGQNNSEFINVYGKAELNIQADMLTTQFKIGVVKKTLEESKIEHKLSTEKLLEILEDTGVKSENIEIHPLRFRKHYDYEKGKRIFRGYLAENNIQLKIYNLSRYYTIMDKVTSVTNLEMGNSTFGLADKPKYNDEINKKALLAARKKAELMAETMEVKLGKVLEIDEVGESHTYAPKAANYAAVSVVDNNISGLVKISKTVRIKFQIINN